jgi:hypothetical protein
VASGEKTKVEVKNGGKRRSGEESRIKYEASEQDHYPDSLCKHSTNFSHINHNCILSNTSISMLIIPPTNYITNPKAGRNLKRKK